MQWTHDLLWMLSWKEYPHKLHSHHIQQFLLCTHLQELKIWSNIWIIQYIVFLMHWCLEALLQKDFGPRDWKTIHRIHYSRFSKKMAIWLGLIFINLLLLRISKLEVPLEPVSAIVCICIHAYQNILIAFERLT